MRTAAASCTSNAIRRTSGGRTVTSAADCTAHFIRTDLLTAGVTESLRQVTGYAARHEARFMKLLTEQNEDGSKRRNAAKKKELGATANAEKFMKVVRKYTSFEELTPTLLREFVEKIVIHESEALDGKRRGKLRRQEAQMMMGFFWPSTPDYKPIPLHAYDYDSK